MGTRIKASVFVGLPRSEFNLDVLERLTEGDEGVDVVLDEASPDYDGRYEDHAIVGFELLSSRNCRATEIVLDAALIGELMEKFKTLTSMDAKLYITPNID